MYKLIKVNSDGLYSFQREDDGAVFCRIQVSLTKCCGLNGLQSFTAYGLNTKESVDEAIEALSNIKDSSYGLYPLKDFIFTCGIGKRYSYSEYNLEDKYKHLINHPKVQKIHQYPSQSEPGHDIGIFKLSL